MDEVKFCDQFRHEGGPWLEKGEVVVVSVAAATAAVGRVCPVLGGRPEEGAIWRKILR